MSPAHDRLWLVPAGKIRAAKQIARANGYPAAFRAGGGPINLNPESESMNTLEQYLAKHPLISKDSPLYVKRLARELNSQENGFYAKTSVFKVRCNRARIVGGVLQCHSLSCEPAWFAPVNNFFEDYNGNEVVASRKS